MCYLGAAYMRIWLLNSDYQEVISDHIEVSTPVNAWKRGTNYKHSVVLTLFILT